MTRAPLTSTLTDRYQTTIPEAVRQHLGLHKRDQVRYELLEDGRVQLALSQPTGEDAALRPFLALLARDLLAQPARLQPLDDARRERLITLVQDVQVDLDAPLDPADG